MTREEIEEEIIERCEDGPESHDTLWAMMGNRIPLVELNNAISRLLNRGAITRTAPGMYSTNKEPIMPEIQVFVPHDQEAKADAGKPELSYLLEFPKALAGMSRVSEYGARKYGRNTWRRVEKQRYIDALLRHTFAIGTNGLGKDSESSLFHIWQVMWNAAAIAELIEEEMQCTSN